MDRAVQRHISVLTAAVAALGMTATLSGCGTGGGSGDVTLKLVAADYGHGSEDGSQKYWDDLARAYEKKNPGIRIDVKVYAWKDVDREVATMVKNGQAPDMAQIGAYADYAKEDRLYSADSLLSVPVQSNFLTQLRDAGTVRGTQYGMPFGASTRLLFYNKKLFKDAGAEPPTTWDELRRAAAKLKADGVKYPFALPLGTEESQAETMMWMLSGGGGYQDENRTSYRIDSAQNVKTFTWLRDDLVGKGLTGPVVPGKLDRAQAFDAFTKGDVGMLNGHPTLMQKAAKAGIDYGMVPLPGTSGKARATMGVADWMMAFKQNGHRKETGKFLDYVYNDANVLAFSREYDILPVTVTGSDELRTDSQHADLKPFLDALPNSELYPFSQVSWAKVSETVKQEIGKAVQPGGNPAAVLAKIAGKARDAEAEE
ncbi:extracellular solute-binding protein [Streptomyces sp. NPDC001941]|uniref:ABC transporter substrate-binding protein n=1 Tax=Streptomyces sp. NPDC001941 TaxID=3154659 RepID=UPI0033279DA7